MRREKEEGKKGDTIFDLYTECVNYTLHIFSSLSLQLMDRQYNLVRARITFKSVERKTRPDLAEKF